MRSSLRGLFLVLLACSDDPMPPAVTSVAPADGHVVFATRLTVRGTGFPAGARVFLIQPGGGERLPLGDVSVAGPEELSATVPAGKPAGEYLIQVDGDAATGAAGGAFTLFSGQLEITVLDVDQGDGALIRAPSGRSLLIDAGKTGQGLSRVIPFLGRVGAGQPDYVLVTHFDDDHLGGIVEYLNGADKLPNTGDERWPKRGLYDHGDNHGCNTNTCDKYYALRTAAGQRMPPLGGEARGLVPGEEIPLGGGVRVTVVAVNGQFPNGGRVATATENDNSVATLIEFGDFRYMTAGDISGGAVPGRPCTGGVDVEGPLASFVGDVSVLHVDHHGSCTSTNPVALDRWKPEVAVISVGRDNSFCHPDQRVLNLLGGTGAAIYATSDGMVTPSAKCAAMWGDADSDPPQKTVLPASAVAAFGDIRISTSDGVSYRVQVLSTAGDTQLHSATYVSKP